VSDPFATLIGTLTAPLDSNTISGDGVPISRRDVESIDRVGQAFEENVDDSVLQLIPGQKLDALLERQDVDSVRRAVGFGEVLNGIVGVVTTLSQPALDGLVDDDVDAVRRVLAFYSRLALQQASKFKAKYRLAIEVEDFWSDAFVEILNVVAAFGKSDAPRTIKAFTSYVKGSLEKIFFKTASEEWGRSYTTPTGEVRYTLPPRRATEQGYGNRVSADYIIDHPDTDLESARDALWDFEAFHAKLHPDDQAILAVTGCDTSAELLQFGVSASESVHDAERRDRDAQLAARFGVKAYCVQRRRTYLLCLFQLWREETSVLTDYRGPSFDDGSCVGHRHTGCRQSRNSNAPRFDGFRAHHGHDAKPAARGTWIVGRNHDRNRIAGVKNGNR
jgi:hypothetical protein